MKRRDILLLILLIPCFALCVVFSLEDLLPITDVATRRLLTETLPRLIAGGYLIFLLCMKGYGGVFHPKFRAVHLLWALPCLAVAVVNFPFSALIRGDATVERVDLLWLFLLKCLPIALLEETAFRAFLVPTLSGEGAWRKLRGVLLSAAIFSLIHLVNLFSSAPSAVLLQVGYTFLLGCMLAVMLMRTGNVWLCVLVHFLFDVGGMIVTDLGSGSFQDTVFWVLTAVFGVLCAIHCILTFLKFCGKIFTHRSQNE